MRIGTRGKRLYPVRITVLAVALFGANLLAANDPGPGERFNSLGHRRLICACGCNQILLECNHVGCPLSDRMRTELAAAVQRGDSDDLTLQAFVQKYGPMVLAAPPTSGFNLLAWITPFVVLALATAGLMMVVRNWRLRAPSAPLPPPRNSSPELDSYRRRAREETEL